MADPKIVKNSKTLKFPYPTGSVSAVFKQTMQKAIKQGWTKIVVIGEGKHGGHWHYSKMDFNEVIGLLENAKYLMQKDGFQ